MVTEPPEALGLTDNYRRQRTAKKAAAQTEMNDQSGPPTWIRDLMSVVVAGSVGNMAARSMAVVQPAAGPITTNSDVRARAQSPKPAQAGPGKPSRARALFMDLGGLRLRLQFSEARAVGLSRGLNLEVLVPWAVHLSA